MFVTPYKAEVEALQPLAAKIGCKLGEISLSADGYATRPALAGNTFGIKDQLKALGFRWSSADKVWYAPTADYDQIAAFLKSAAA